MNKVRRRAMAVVFVLGLVAGMFGQSSTYAFDPEACTPGCCGYTVDCGSPFEWRCCVRDPQMTICEQACKGYCIEGSCGAAAGI